jgi:hypothetical protein
MKEGDSDEKVALLKQINVPEVVQMDQVLNDSPVSHAEECLLY